MSTQLKLQRLGHANDLIKVISSHGRRFFFNATHNRVAFLNLDHGGRVWFNDDYRGSRIFTHPTHMGNRWQGFSHGGTLRSLVEDMRDYIVKGQQIPRWKIVIKQMGAQGLEDNIWGYSVDAAEAVQREAFKLPIVAGEGGAV